MKPTATQPQLQGKVALVTGGNRGIGLALAHALAAEGCDVVITGRNQASLKKAANQLGRKTVPMLCDVRDTEAVGRLFANIKQRFRNLDILINNAGVAHANLNIDQLPVETWREVIDTNLTGMFLVVRAALPLMHRGSAIVNNLSIAAKRVFPGASAYNASKYGALGFTNTLREEVRVRGIRVIALMPGATDTEIWNTSWPTAPRKKMLSPATVAQAVVNALTLPEACTVEELVILPSAGVL
jgi:NAD(P)-dependent dehydrogenase (short-subunit alcohol dehydrogenase family)